MVFEDDLKNILEKRKGDVITDELIRCMISDWKKLFVCNNDVENVEKYYKD